MRFRLGYACGFATGYYLGAKAGRQRYDQINQTVRKLRRSDTFETVAEKAKTVVDEGVEKAKDLVDRSNTSDDSTNTGPGGSANGTNSVPAAAPLPGSPTGYPYSSSK